MYFPFDKVRPIQQDFAKDVEDAVRNGKNLIAHAPTGLGKTAGSLAPALTVALEKGYNIFFLTPKHSQHQIALETLRKIRQKHDIKFYVADLIGKKWMCSHGAVEKLSSKEFNEFCKGLREDERCPYYNNVWGVKSQLQGSASNKLLELKASDFLHAEDLIRDVKDDFCAYEIATLLAKDAQVVIADYYHVFQPRVRKYFLARLKKELKNTIIIVDEAHNLPNRIRDILTQRMTSINIRRAAKEARVFKYLDLATGLNYLADGFENLANAKVETYSDALIRKEDLIKELEKSTGYSYLDFHAELEVAALEIRREAKRSFVGSVSDFLEAWTGPDIGFTRIIKKQKTKAGNKYVMVSYSCLSPDVASKEVFDAVPASILMSGTLVPGELYKNLLGLNPVNTIIKEYPSPFTEKNRLVLIEPSTTTKYTSRDMGEYQNIGTTCAEMVTRIPHNVGVFFPSYFVMKQVYPFLTSKLKGKQVFMDSQEYSKEQRVNLLNNFKQASKEGAVLLAVQGGSFAEGVDLPGKFLEAVIVIGVPLSTPDLETKSLIEYYDHKFGRGWDYGYIFPAMTRALQSAGRCIRDIEDRGVIVFMDKRYTWANYLKCIPPEWKPIITKLPNSKIENFFIASGQELSP